MQDIYFEITSSLSKRIRITKQRWDLIITVKHQNTSGKEELVKSTLIAPDEVRRSNSDNTVFIYYKHIPNYFVAVVCKHLNGAGYIITVYMTDRIKQGERVW